MKALLRQESWRGRKNDGRREMGTEVFSTHGQFGLAIGLPLGLGLAALGGAVGLGRAVASAMEAIGRQPEASTKILVAMVTGCAFIEALTIYALVFAFSMSGKI